MNNWFKSIGFVQRELIRHSRNVQLAPKASKLILVAAGLAVLLLLGQAGLSSLNFLGAPVEAAGVAEIPVVVRPGGATVYAGPAGEALGAAQAGTVLSATARSTDGDWVQVRWSDQTGWVKTSTLIAVDVESLPMVNLAPPTPTSTPSPAPTPTPAVTPSPAAASESVPTTASSAAAEELQGVVGTQGASLVDSPDGATTTVLPAGTIIAILAQTPDGEWLQVRTAPGASGWVQTQEILAPDLIGLATPSSAPTTADLPVDATPASGEPVTITTSVTVTGVVSTENARLNVRAGPGLDQSIIAKANPGESYPVLARDQSGDWLQIRLPDATDAFGWVAARYMTLTGPATDLPVSDAVSHAPALSSSTAQAPAPVAQNAVPGSTAEQPSGTIVFQTRSGGPIYIMNGDGTGLRYLTDGLDPALSPDGSQVAYTRWSDPWGLYIIDADGSDERRLTGENQIKAPTWSPDGERLAFSIQKGGTEGRTITLPGGRVLSRPGQDFWRLEMVNADGSGREGVPDEMRSFTPQWTEQGILFASGGNIYRTEPGGAPQLVYSGSNQVRNPALSPDGRFIVATMEFANHWEIVRLNADGSGLVRLTPLSALSEDVYHSVAAVWSPDGSAIAFLTDRTGPWSLWIMDANGDNARPLAPETLAGVEFQYDFAAERVLDWK